MDRDGVRLGKGRGLGERERLRGGEGLGEWVRLNEVLMDQGKWGMRRGGAWGRGGA